MSCGKESGIDDIYQVVILSRENQRIPGRFNVLTGSVSPLCEDPVCTHGWDSGCAFEIFLQTSPYTLFDGKFYYMTKDFRDFDSDYSLRCYDLSDGGIYAIDLSDYGECVVAEDGLGSFVLDGNYVCYTKPADAPPYLGYDRNDHEDKYNTTGGTIWRADILTGETVKLFDDAAYNLEYWTIERVGSHLVINYTNTDYSTFTEEAGNGRFGAVYVYPSDTGKIVIDMKSTECMIYEVSYNYN